MRPGNRLSKAKIEGNNMIKAYSIAGVAPAIMFAGLVTLFAGCAASNDMCGVELENKGRKHN